MLFVLSIVKVIGIILAGAFSALGLFTDFKDKNTQTITRWGKIALYGIIASTVVSLLSQTLESWKTHKDTLASESTTQRQLQATQEQLKGIAAVLHDMDRVLSPIKNLSLHYRITLPLDDAALSTYRKRLEHEHKGSSPLMFVTGIFHLTPEVKRREGLAASVAMCAHFELDFFPANSPNEPTLAVMAVPDFKKPQVPPAANLLPPPEPSHYEYDPPHHLLHISGDLHPGPDFWQSRGDATYLADLQGGALNIVLYPLPAPCQVMQNPAELQAYHRIINQIKLEGISLAVSGRSFDLFSRDFVAPLMANPQMKPDRFLLETIKNKDRVVYRAKLPLNLREIESPRPDKPIVVVGTQAGVALAMNLNAIIS